MSNVAENCKPAKTAGLEIPFPINENVKSSGKKEGKA